MPKLSLENHCYSQPFKDSLTADKKFKKFKNPRNSAKELQNSKKIFCWLLS